MVYNHGKPGVCDHLFYSEPTYDKRDAYISGLDVRPRFVQWKAESRLRQPTWLKARCQSNRNGTSGSYAVWKYCFVFCKRSLIGGRGKEMAQPLVMASRDT